MTKIAEKPPANQLFETDFFLWTQEQARLLREKRWNDLDLENLAEEVRSVGGSEKKEIRSRLDVLLMHLLKWTYQPGKRTPSWQTTIRRQRIDLQGVLDDSPSLRPYIKQVFSDRYPSARLLAEDETGIAFDLFPEECPFTLEEVMDSKYLPDEPGILEIAKKKK